MPKIVSVPSKQDGSGIGVPSTGPKTFKMPESSLLARARMFLPKLKEANDKLEKDVAAGASVDMEARGPEESAMIQMVALCALPCALPSRCLVFVSKPCGNGFEGCPSLARDCKLVVCVAAVLFLNTAAPHARPRQE